DLDIRLDGPDSERLVGYGASRDDDYRRSIIVRPAGGGDGDRSGGEHQETDGADCDLRTFLHLRLRNDGAPPGEVRSDCQRWSDGLTSRGPGKFPHCAAEAANRSIGRGT